MYTHSQDPAKTGSISSSLNFTYFHVDSNNHIRIKEPDTPQQLIKSSVKDYILNSSIEEGSCVRLVGSSRNAALIVALYNLGCTVYVCTPSVIVKKKLINDDQCINELIRWPGLSPSQGGWHVINDTDIATYKITAAINNKTKDDLILKLWNKHPLYVPLSFINNVDHLSCAYLIGIIRDPRWYIDLRAPDRVELMLSYLGMYKRHYRNKSAGYKYRRELTLKAWQGKSLPSIVDIESLPSCFLWRIYQRQHIKYAVERATRRFLRFIRLVWLDILYDSSIKDMFVPEYFFDQPDEVLAYTAHINLQK